MGGASKLIQTIGRFNAMDMLLTGKIISAKHAKTMGKPFHSVLGLISDIYQENVLYDKVNSMCEEISKSDVKPLLYYKKISQKCRSLL